MAHPVTNLLESYGINRHDIGERSYQGFKRLLNDTAAMFKHNYLLYRQLQLSGAFVHALRGLLYDWKQSADLTKTGMIDALQALLDEHSDVDPSELVKNASECHCPPGFACPACSGQPQEPHPLEEACDASQD